MEKIKKEKKSYPMTVSLEFKQLCDDYRKKVSEVTWNSVDYSYVEITRIITKKIKGTL
jgi:hypothetical protein